VPAGAVQFYEALGTFNLAVNPHRAARCFDDGGSDLRLAAMAVFFYFFAWPRLMRQLEATERGQK